MVQKQGDDLLAFEPVGAEWVEGEPLLDNFDDTPTHTTQKDIKFVSKHLPPILGHLQEYLLPSWLKYAVDRG